MTKTIYVVGDDRSVGRMFEGRGWIVEYLISNTGDGADLICFTGGADIQPHLYGEENTGKSHCNPERDLFEIDIYERYLGNTPMVGICRGGQLLNVLNGGKLMQHCGPSHGIVKCHSDDDEFYVDVCHHQGIIPPKEGCRSILTRTIDRGVYDYASWFSETKSLCFQPHPEWGHEGTRGLFFDLIADTIGES